MLLTGLIAITFVAMLGVMSYTFFKCMSSIEEFEDEEQYLFED